MTENLSTSVLIVGGGPTGLLASILLSKHEIPHVLIEQREGTLQAPAAHVVNTRTMEIYRQAGLNVDELYGLNTHPAARLIAWKSRLENEPIGVFDAGASRDALAAQSRFSGEHTTNISQHRLEDYLKRHAEQSAYADIRFGVEWLGFAGEDNQNSCLKSRDGNQIEVRHEYMLAADGAGSPVARALHVKRVGPDAIATFLNLTCEVDLAQRSGDADSLLYWILDPEVQGTFIVHDPHKLAVYMRPLAIPYESAEDYDDERCTQLLGKVFGDQPYKIRHKGVWKMTAQVADRFRIGPVFLVGDSAHRFPPTGGLGLNTGVGDVHNLVWKLAVALKGEIPEDQVKSLLESYELERRPVAQRNCDVSKRNNDKMIEVILALGLDPSKTHLLHKVMNSVAVRLLPEFMQRGIFNQLTRPVRALLSDAEGDHSEGEAIRGRVAEAIDNQREHFSSIGLDLGYVYREGVAVSNEAKETPESEVSSYTESVGPGARLPHRVLADGMRLHDKLDYRGFTVFQTDDAMIPELDSFGMEKSVESIDGAILGSHKWVLVRPDGHVMAVG
ncbi:MAG: FAD-dependent monooxygenase [Pseudomonadota bacterium]